MRWLESARAALMRCEQAANDDEATALAQTLRAAIHTRTEALRAHVRQRIDARYPAGLGSAMPQMH
ncbi:MAG: hypothetical protein IPG63_04340 [Xanthomonadales bacterium]|nr:hypothetical protein [Xanthomonadales bacterium]MBK7144867.1 hypothetical protein [Xanthomonadales bacterium]MCC6560078.1 hypothetical protein [Xanthomonadales bacterium]